MREIEFRGKRKFDNTWIYGGYMKTARTNKIQIGGTSRFCTVYPETLGQYTGLKDKNGTKIFEGDIVELHDKVSNIHWTAIVEFGNPNAEYTWGWQLKLLNILEPTGTKQAYWNKDILLWVELEVAQVSCEVIGNIYDNPELVEKVEG